MRLYVCFIRIIPFVHSCHLSLLLALLTLVHCAFVKQTGPNPPSVLAGRKGREDKMG